MEMFTRGVASFGQHFIGLFQTGAMYFLNLFLFQLLPWIIIMMAFMNIAFKLIGLERIEKLAAVLGKFPLTRWTLMPMLGMMFSGNPMTYPYARFLPENQKVAFFDAAISYCHPVTGLFPHANPGELFVYLGIAGGVFFRMSMVSGVTMNRALPWLYLGFLAVQYFLMGLIMILIRGIVTQIIYNIKAKKFLKDKVKNRRL